MRESIAAADRVGSNPPWRRWSRAIWALNRAALHLAKGRDALVVWVCLVTPVKHQLEPQPFDVVLQAGRGIAHIQNWLGRRDAAVRVTVVVMVVFVLLLKSSARHA